jgi:lysophospholipase L1-like esterase
MIRISRAAKLAALTMAGALALAGVVASPATASPASFPGTSSNGVRIMPLGDSITDGTGLNGYSGGYRTTLYNNLTGAGFNVDFVGTNSGGPANLADKDHEGHIGWTTQQARDAIVPWLYGADPRTILLQLGTNDANLGNTDATTTLEPLIDLILAVKPNVQLFVASITPVDPAKFPDLAARVPIYNSSIPSIVARKGPNVHFVNMNAALTVADIGDGIHPNPAGFEKMAAVWTNQLATYPAALQAPPAPPVPFGQTISIQAYGNGLNLTAWLSDANAPVQARVDHVSTWERFRIVNAGNGWVGVQSLANGLYVSTIPGTGFGLYANSPQLSSWEMYRWVDYGNGYFGLASAHGNVVSARVDTANGPLFAIAPHIAGWELFHWAAA